MSGKKLINKVTEVVPDALRGAVASNPDVAILAGQDVLLRSDLEALEGKVAIICGGGSGHEPAHAGYVGRGMLTGAVAGAVFTSPPVSAILSCLRTIWAQGRPQGILLVVKNYTGDRINFGLALERAKALGVNCEMVVVGDDCALTSKDKSAGRRGLAGTVLVHKIAGAMAEKGESLDAIVSFLKEKILPCMGTIGLSLSACSLPGSGPSFTLEKDEIELGLGIHGEAGVKRLKLDKATSVVTEMLRHMTDKASATHLDVEEGTDVVVMLNNLGGTSNLEMGILTNEVSEQVKSKGWNLDRIYAGPFMTALEMAGFSITVLKSNKKILECLDLEVSALAWPRNPQQLGIAQKDRVTIISQEDSEVSETAGVDDTEPFSSFGQSLSDKSIEFACEAIKSCEGQLNKFDSGAGDGDCGMTLTRGAEKLQEMRSRGLKSTVQVFETISSIAEESMGGSAGAMYSILFATAASELRRSGKSSGNDPAKIFAALTAGVAAMMKYGGAAPGDRTMLDALVPAFKAFQGVEGSLEGLEKAAVAAEEGAKATVSMKASAGRASYVAENELKNPDPGAHAVGIIMRAVYQAVLSRCQEAGLN